MHPVPVKTRCKLKASVCSSLPPFVLLWPLALASCWPQMCFVFTLNVTASGIEIRRTVVVIVWDYISRYAALQQTHFTQKAC